MFRTILRKSDKSYLRWGPYTLTSPIGRRNEYLVPRLPPPDEINKLIDSRDEYDDSPN